jgi:hypothetical protein
MHCRIPIISPTTISAFLMLVSLDGCSLPMRSPSSAPPSEAPAVAPLTTAAETPTTTPSAASADGSAAPTTPAVQSPPAHPPVPANASESAVSTGHRVVVVRATAETKSGTSRSEKVKPAGAHSAAEVSAAVAPRTGIAGLSTDVGAPEPAATKAAEPAALDLASLEQRLRDTPAIGVFTKLSLKNQVDDLLGQFRTYYRGDSKISLADLRERYNLLLLKVLTLLQDTDASLAAAISSSREAIWAILTDPNKFAKL